MIADGEPISELVENRQGLPSVVPHWDAGISNWICFLILADETVVTASIVIGVGGLPTVGRIRDVEDAIHCPASDIISILVFDSGERFPQPLYVIPALSR